MPKKVTCVDIHGKTYTVSADQLRWRPSAYGVVIKDDRVLLTKQRGGYDLPGGGLDLGEAPEEAVIREVKEETGIIVKSPQLTAVHTTFFKLPDVNGSFVQSLLMYYVCEYESGEPSLQYLEEYERPYSELAEWVSLDDFNVQVSQGMITSSFDWRALVKKVAGIS